MSQRARTTEKLLAAGVVAVVRTPTADAAVEVVKALAAGGVIAAEITFTVPNAAAAIARVRDLDLGVLLGAGTVTTAEQAHQAIDAGATYLVSPHLALEVMGVADERDVSTLPGALTPAEVFAAWAAGADVVKIFPAARMGPSYIKDLRGPYPDIPMMPTGGVSAANVHEWIAAGAVAVGVGSELVNKQSVAEQNWADLSRRAEELMAALHAAREEH
ncbi:MAG: bifunctional 4-hydroxy-2-oxoglutarate aldolase/2-dehydro-3-deoxy-phosphogluconate aldolase [Planctomycetota bacterium]